MTLEIDLSSEIWTIGFRVIAVLFLLPILLQQIHFLVSGWSSDDTGTTWTRIVLVTWGCVLQWTNVSSIWLWWYIHEYDRLPSWQAGLGLGSSILFAIASVFSFVLFWMRQRTRDQAKKQALLEFNKQNLGSAKIDEKDRIEGQISRERREDEDTSPHPYVKANQYATDEADRAEGQEAREGRNNPPTIIAPDD